MYHKPLSCHVLSEQDRRVLNSIFINSKVGDDIDSHCIPTTDLQIRDPPEEKTKESEISAECERKAIELTESGNLIEAISLFDEALRYANHKGSIYNNRAQALRLKGDEEGALKDLAKSIELSPHHPRTRCLALCQRGVLYRKMGNDDGAKHDFQEAANLGSSFARGQLVEMNPYSALCNQMLRSVFSKMQ